ncbi:MAG: DUF4160 domain-containing protein [bacterium]|nr:DUF4160 domain-containing protein [bacterium]
MPTVLKSGEFKVLIFVNDHPPAHVHVRKGAMLAKISLEADVKLIRYDKDLGMGDLRKMMTIVQEHRDFLLEKWNELYGDKASE